MGGHRSRNTQMGSKGSKEVPTTRELTPEEQADAVQKLLPCYVTILELLMITLIFTTFNVSYLTLGNEDDDGIDFDPWSVTPLRMLTASFGCLACGVARYPRYTTSCQTLLFILAYFAVGVLMAICMCVDAKDYVDMKDKAEKAETVHVYTACHYKADGQRTCKIAPVYMSVPIFSAFSGVFFIATSIALYCFRRELWGDSGVESTDTDPQDAVERSSMGVDNDHGKTDNPWR